MGSRVGPDPKAILKIQFLGGHCSDSKNVSVVLTLCLEICHPSKQPTSQKRKLRLGEEVGPTQGPITEAKLPWGGEVVVGVYSMRLRELYCTLFGS